MAFQFGGALTTINLSARILALRFFIGSLAPGYRGPDVFGLKWTSSPNAEPPSSFIS